MGVTTIEGGFNANDSSGLSAPPGNPCAIALFNSAGLNLDLSLTGYGVRSYVSKITLPFNQSTYQQVEGDLRILPSDNVVLLYIGSKTNQEQLGGIVWTVHQE